MLFLSCPKRVICRHRIRHGVVPPSAITGSGWFPRSVQQIRDRTKGKISPLRRWRVIFSRIERGPVREFSSVKSSESRFLSSRRLPILSRARRRPACLHRSRDAHSHSTTRLDPTTIITPSMPKSRHSPMRAACPLSANSALPPPGVRNAGSTSSAN